MGTISVRSVDIGPLPLTCQLCIITWRSIPMISLMNVLFVSVALRRSRASRIIWGHDTLSISRKRKLLSNVHSRVAHLKVLPKEIAWFIVRECISLRMPKLISQWKQRIPSESFIVSVARKSSKVTPHSIIIFWNAFKRLIFSRLTSLVISCKER